MIMKLRERSTEKHQNPTYKFALDALSDRKLFHSMLRIASVAQPAFMQGQPMMRHLPTIGVLQDKMTSYRKACQEGWAPAPTNEYQKAVWEQERGTKK